MAMQGLNYYTKDEIDGLLSTKSDGGWGRLDIDSVHFLWKNIGFDSKSKSWETLGTAPDDLKDGTMVFCRWTGVFGHSLECQSYSAQMETDGTIKAAIDSNGANGGYAFVVIIK